MEMEISNNVKTKQDLDTMLLKIRLNDGDQFYMRSKLKNMLQRKTPQNSY